MQQKTDGRVVRLFTKYVGAEGRSIEQWFLVAIGDDDKATDAVAKSANAADAVFEIVGHIPATTLASWGMTEGEVRLVLPGEPISGWQALAALANCHDDLHRGWQEKRLALSSDRDVVSQHTEAARTTTGSTATAKATATPARWPDMRRGVLRVTSYS
jgi:hypothetical protein